MTEKKTVQNFHVGFFKGEELDSFEPIDYELWSTFVRSKRKKMGYISVTRFVKTVFLRTRVYIKEQSYYKIEQGRQKPTTNQFFALNLVVFGTLLPPADIMAHAVSDEWKEVLDVAENPKEHDTIVPLKWAEENFAKCCDECVETGYVDDDFIGEDTRLFKSSDFDSGDE